MHFGKRLSALQYPPWSPFYLDYNHLKQILKCRQAEEDPEYAAGSRYSNNYMSRARSGGTLSAASASHSDLKSVDLSVWSTASATVTQHPITVEFVSVLETEVERILHFCLQIQGQLATQLSKCRERLHTAETLAHCRAVYESYSPVALTLLRLIQFVEVNVTGVRKILKKHDKLLHKLQQYHHHHQRLSSLFLAGSRRPRALRGSILVQPLLHDTALQALTVSLELGLEDCKRVMVQMEETAPASMLWQIDEPIRLRSHTEGAAEEVTGPSNELDSRSDHNVELAAIAVAESPGWKRGEPATVTSYGGSLTNRRSPEHVLLQIHAARKRLQQTSEFVQLLAAPMMMTEGSLEEEGEDDDEVRSQQEEEPVQPSREISSMLNLLSTFLYMANYYIVAPTSGSYATLLGGTASMSTLIIGMTPVAALVSTLLYSWWTSHSYKAALIFASTCSIVGNLLYAMGLPTGSLGLVLAGRLINGFGSARSINRRYIADSYSKQERTAASAAFVTAGALGMAAGPAAASGLHVLVDQFHSQSAYLQVQNAPGWFMFVIWTIYLIFLCLFFEDPIRPVETKIEANGEREALLKVSGGSLNGQHERAVPIPVDTSIWRNVPVLMTFTIYFILKLILEAVLSSAPMVTEYYFHWSGTLSGVFLAGLGLLMLPANLLVAWLARTYDDRELIVGIQFFMVAGCLIILDYADFYTVWQYLIGSIVIFLSTNALEGPNMSLLSKTIPKSWSKGFFNVGLLATEAGTLGRAVADVALTVCGRDGLEYLVNRCFGGFAVLSFLTLFLTSQAYDTLEPVEKDD